MDVEVEVLVDKVAVVEISDVVEVVVAVVKVIEIELVESTVVCVFVTEEVMLSSISDISVAGTSVLLVCGDMKLLVSPLATVSSLSAARPGLPRFRRPRLAAGPRQAALIHYRGHQQLVKVSGVRLTYTTALRTVFGIPTTPEAPSTSQILLRTS